MSPQEPRNLQPSVSISSGKTSSSHRRVKSADPELFPLSASPRPASREGARRTRHSAETDIHTAPPQKHQGRETRPDSLLYEPAFSIPSETKVKRDKLARVCKILGREVPSNAVFPSPPTYEEIEKADRKASRRSYTPMFPEDCVVDVHVRAQSPAAPPSKPAAAYMFPEDYLPHVRADRDKQAAEKKARAAEKEKKSGRRSYMPMFPEECVGPNFDSPPNSKRGPAPTYAFPEDYLPHIREQRDAQVAKAEQQSRWYRSPLDTIAELKSSSTYPQSPPHDFSSSSSSSSDSAFSSDDDSRFSLVSSTTSSSYRFHPPSPDTDDDSRACSPEGAYAHAGQHKKGVGRREIGMYVPFRRRAGGLGSRAE